MSSQDGYKAQQSKGLQALAIKPNDVRVSAVEAWALACSLTRDDEVCRVWWPKLVGRPAEAVRALSRDLRASSPTARQHIISEFAKKNPAMPKEEGKG